MKSKNLMVFFTFPSNWPRWYLHMHKQGLGNSAIVEQVNCIRDVRMDNNGAMICLSPKNGRSSLLSCCYKCCLPQKIFSEMTDGIPRFKISFLFLQLIFYHTVQFWKANVNLNANQNWFLYQKFLDFWNDKLDLILRKVLEDTEQMIKMWQKDHESKSLRR